jgi:hypothetical protein
MEEISWRQKSRVLWLKEGDSSKFFHHLANSHHSANTIGQLSINEDLSTNQEAIKEHIAQFYEQLYMECGYRHPLLDGLQFSSINEEDVELLEKPFYDIEVFNILIGDIEVFNMVMGFNGDKVPGLDGFPLAFFQSCWSIVRNDVMVVFQEFYEQGKFVLMQPL